MAVSLVWLYLTMERLGIRTVCFLLISSVSALSGNETDRLSLLDFKAKIEGDPLGLLRSWNDSVHLCSWPGVACSRRHRERVTELDVSRWQLAGPLSPQIGNLSFLRVLNLANNSFSGREIPPEIGRLSRLRLLNFRNNSFGGEIPANVSGCSRLRFLSLHSNDLAGEIPAEIGSLSDLRIVELGDNNLSGEIPDSVGNLSLLEELYVGNNNLQGNIPSSFGRLKSLRVLVLHENNLTGTIPIPLYNVSTIEIFSMIFNKLEGTLPTNFGQTLPNLRDFSIMGNYFSGSIPASVSNLSNLYTFQIGENNFSGKVPTFGTPLNLRRLSIYKNSLGFAENGDLDFLRDLVNCTKLEILGISYNNLGGSIPETMSNMTSTRLRRLEFGFNKIVGDIPSGIGNLVSLEVLGLEVNQLSGSIPSTIGKLVKLNFLTFDSNELSGTIPTTLRNLTLLSTLSLARNNIQGIIPPSLGECRNLQGLTLGINNLTGPIPPELISLSSLTRYLDLSRNQLTGSIPLEVGKLQNLGGLYISENKLSGEIPEDLGSCISMEYLYMEGNFFRGSIPYELNALRGLKIVDFSRNNLSGRIPDFFSEFRGLEYLNLSFNDFEGQVPIHGTFTNASEFSVIGNAKLCGGLPELRLPKCANGNRKPPQKTKLAVIVSVSIVGSIVIVIIAMLLFLNRKRTKPVVERSVEILLPRVSYGNLSEATDGFASESLIGSGSFGSVYKGILGKNRTLVAVKVLNLDVTRALKSFEVECESLGRIRHRNIAKLVTVCSSTDFRGNDFKALVYEFMENGNLDEWLHSDRGGSKDQSRRLNLVRRINIAVDVASALDYLHNHCSEPIAHCDIKPSNVLLDGQMVAHVGDFGLAKLLRTASSSNNDQTSSVGVRGTVGYIAPEYATGSEVSTLGDIYSYGILLLEMLSGKKPTDSIFKDDFNLHSLASVALKEHISKFVDPMLLEEEEEEEEEGYKSTIHGFDDQTQQEQKCLISIVEIGVACSSKFPRERKNMGDVVAELCQIRDILNGRRKAKNHVTKVIMLSGYPMPPISINWRRYHYKCAEGWATPYAAHVKVFRDLIGDDVATQETIDLDSS